MKTYRIVRFRFKGSPSRKGLPTGLSLEEAQAHCKDEKTHKINKDGDVVWFDGYEVEEGDE